MLLFIHRKDLRVEDMPALDYIHSLRLPSLHVLIVDPALFLHDRQNEHSGINFLQHTARLRQLYAEAGQQLHLLYGEPASVVRQLLATHPITKLVFHEDFSPYASVRDGQLHQLAQASGVDVVSFDDQALVDLRDFQRWSGRSEPYKVFTPFYRRWSDYLLRFYRPAYGVHIRQLATAGLAPGIALAHALPAQLAAAAHEAPSAIGASAPQGVLRRFLAERLAGYAEERDRFALEGTSQLSRHLNVGALSVRALYEAMLREEQHETWLRQLAWRDFYLYQARLDSDFFRYESQFDWLGFNDRHLQAWCEARTGIPIIDAAMTQLQTTGWLPNRLRMVSAMFLTKNLLCPFTYGERYFRCKLSDYDHTLNRGGWLWCASLGFDAAPYFRIMNPATQSITHDPHGDYIRHWLPELASLPDKQIHLPRPHAIVDLKASRATAIMMYKQLLTSKH